MRATTKTVKGNEICRGCKDIFPKADHELNYEGYCDLCQRAQERLERALAQDRREAQDNN